MQLFNKRQRKKDDSGAGDVSTNLLRQNSSDVAFDSGNIVKPLRSTPSKRHLNADGTSGQQLFSLLEKVAPPVPEKRISRIKRGTKKKLNFIIKGKPKETSDGICMKKNTNTGNLGIVTNNGNLDISEEIANVHLDVSEETARLTDESSEEDIRRDLFDDSFFETDKAQSPARTSLEETPIFNPITPPSTFEGAQVRKVKLKEGGTRNDRPHPIQANKVDSRLTLQTDESSGLLRRVLDNPSSAASTFADSKKEGSRMTLATDESSGRQLQHILERLVDNQISITSSENSEGFEFENSLIHVDSGPLYKDDPSPAPSPKSVTHDFFDQEGPKTRFEMSDNNEQSRMYIQSRKKVVKRPIRAFPIRASLVRASPKSSPQRSEQKWDNCGMVSQLEISSIISVSSCSFDSVLDDPERLEKYRLLNQAAPVPPARRNFSKWNRDNNFSKWNRDTEFFERSCETLSGFTKFFGCSSS
jgi:hypothetical protein